MSETDKLARDIRLAALVIFMILAGKQLFDLGKDATDPPDGRSGMGLHIDSQTGCHYLSRGGLTPRLDRDGNHICGGN